MTEFIMDITYWLQIAGICLLGAMSPGPSLALVIGNTLNAGRLYGVTTSLGHATGIGWWAFLTAVGVAEIIVGNPAVLSLLQISGACLLAYIGFKTITAKNQLAMQQSNSTLVSSQVLFKGFVEGFMISVLNPKIAVFFLAIFSHIIQTGSSWTETVVIGITAALIDALWYIAVALMLTGTSTLEVREHIIRRISGVILIAIAIYLIFVMVSDLL